MNDIHVVSVGCANMQTLWTIPTPISLSGHVFWTQLPRCLCSHGVLTL